MEFHGIHGVPWIPKNSMDSTDFHGIHGIPWIRNDSGLATRPQCWLPGQAIGAAGAGLAPPGR